MTLLESLPALPDGETLYMYLDVAEAGVALAPVVQELIGEPRLTAKVMERTDQLLLAVSGSDDSPRFTAVAIGAAPVFAIAAGLNFDAGWKRQRGRARWWANTESGVNIAIPTTNHVIVSSADLTDSLSDWEGQRPDHTKGARASFAAAVPIHSRLRDLIAVTEDLSSMAGLGFPPGITAVESIQLLGDFEGDRLTAEIEIELDTTAAARLAGMLVRVLIIAERKQGGAGYFTSSDVEVDDVFVRVTSVDVALSVLVELLGGME